jgi:hypothetical protein
MEWLAVAVLSLGVISGCGGGRGGGNETLEKGSLGVELSYLSGSGQIHARRQVYLNPIRVKIVSTEGQVGVPDMTVTFKETTSTGAIFINKVQTDADGVAETFVTSPNLYSAVVNIKATARDATGEAFFTLTTIPDTVTFIAYGPVNPQSTWYADDVVPFDSFQVQLKDSYGFLIDTNSTDHVQLSLFSGTGALLGTLDHQVTAGVATFNDLTYTTLENIVLRATHVPYG